MTPRPRKRNNKALPPNLYPNRGAYRYKHPHTGQFHGMGTDRAAAIEAAKELNSMLSKPNDLVGQVVGSETVRQHVAWFYREIVPEREYRPKTLEMYGVQFRKLERALGEYPVEDVTVQDLATLMEAQTPRTANQLRQVAVDLFKVAIGRGLREDNPAEATLKRRVKKSRQRLTQKAYDAIHAASKPWMQNAMDLALVTLQRRNDVTRMRFDRIKEGKLYVVQEKTEKYDTGYLAIQIGASLDKIIRRCRDEVASPYLVHRFPKRKIKERAGMDHWTQVQGPMLSREFARVRDEIGLFENHEPDTRPTFHEIRALGIKRYKDQKQNPQQLAGHASAKMTSNYDSDHDEIRWVEASASLDIEHKTKA